MSPPHAEFFWEVHVLAAAHELKNVDPWSKYSWATTFDHKTEEVDGNYKGPPGVGHDTDKRYTKHGTEQCWTSHTYHRLLGRVQTLKRFCLSSLIFRLSISNSILKPCRSVHSKPWVFVGNSRIKLALFLPHALSPVPLSPRTWSWGGSTVSCRSGAPPRCKSGATVSSFWGHCGSVYWRLSEVRPLDDSGLGQNSQKAAYPPPLPEKSL